MSNSKEISLSTSIFPIILLVSMLIYNIFNNEWLGTYTFHIILITTAVIVSIIGLINNVTLSEILIKIYNSVKSIKTPIIILLLVGALAGTWKVSGVIPAMVYYGVNFIDPSIFLPLTLVVTAIVSLTAGTLAPNGVSALPLVLLSIPANLYWFTTAINLKRSF